MTTTYRQPFKGEYPITQSYGEIVPGVTYKDAPHTGIDYACPLGTPVLASADGTVVFAIYDNFGFGNCVILQHPDGKATVYAHLSQIEVRQGQKVKQGEEIGKSGSTGNSTGPHLHFEARSTWHDYKTHEDPVTFLPLRSVDDALPSTFSHTEQTAQTGPVIPEGICKIVCSSAFVRDWETVERSYTIPEGTKVYVFQDVKYRDGLPYRYIGANRCIAEHDSYGTKILARAE